jgi:deazaflavin-dependent oxidoreductase (nitroreductase family)
MAAASEAVVNDWNSGIIEEFRANEGRVGGPFEGRPLLLLHHSGRRSGKEFVAPVMYLAGDGSDKMYVFASKGGAPGHPEWYYNLTAAGKGAVEVGTEKFSVLVRELPADERDGVYAEQARRYPQFGEYEQKTAGVRTIPVLELRRS